jgi:hypothetical protein
MKSVRALVALLFVLAACSSGSGGTPTSCDQACQDGIAVRGLRDAIKLAYNLLLQGGPVGNQNTPTTPCPLGGTVQVQGNATSVPEQGTTMVNLTYDFEGCGYSETDSDPTRTFSLTFTGSITETGSLAADPSSTTALTFDSSSMTFSGTVFNPPKAYDWGDCGVKLGQNGDSVSGTVCDRGPDAGVVGISL